MHVRERVLSEAGEGGQGREPWVVRLARVRVLEELVPRLLARGPIVGSGRRQQAGFANRLRHRASLNGSMGPGNWATKLQLPANGEQQADPGCEALSACCEFEAQESVTDAFYGSAIERL